MSHFLLNQKTLFVALLLSTACASLGFGDKKTSSSSSSAPLSKDEEIALLKSEMTITKDEIAKIRLEMQSLKDHVASSAKELAIMRRGNRSGLFDLPEETPAKEPKHLGVHSSKSVTLQGSVHGSSSSPSFSMGHETKSDSKEKNETADAVTLIQDAESKLTKNQVGEAIVVLEEVRKRFPNVADEGKTTLLLIEAWSKLASSHKVIPLAKEFYDKYQNHSRISLVKLRDAQAHQALGYKKAAADLYKEIIALAPQSAEADTSIKSLEKLRDN